jgi:riboflavin kinase/FMN adenylyltransferase
LQTVTSHSQLGADFANAAVTIGKFDGVHLGHQALLTELIEFADEHSLAPVVISFDRHPDALLNPDRLKLPLIGPHQKQHLLAEAGVEALVNLPFDEHLAALSPRAFVHEVLVNGLRSKVVLVGDSFRFGAGGEGTVDTLRELGSEFGFAVRVVPPVVFDGEVVSTTRIRDLLDQAKVVEAAKLLGRPHITTGMIEHGLKIGRQIGFPTANMSREAEGYLPLDGVYAGWLYADGERYPAALSVGINETFQAVPRLIEAHVIDQTELDLYDKIVSLEYVDFIRPAAKFDGVEALVAEINRDLEKCRVILGKS